MKRGAEAQREKDELEAAARGDVLAPRKRAAVSYAAPAPNQEEKQPEVEVVRMEFHKRDQEVGNEPEYGAPPKTKEKNKKKKATTAALCEQGEGWRGAGQTWRGSEGEGRRCCESGPGEIRAAPCCWTRAGRVQQAPRPYPCVG